MVNFSFKIQLILPPKILAGQYKGFVLGRFTLLRINMFMTMLPSDARSCNRGDKHVRHGRQCHRHGQGIIPAGAIVVGRLAEDIIRRKGTSSPSNVAEDDCRTLHAFSGCRPIIVHAED